MRGKRRGHGEEGGRGGRGRRVGVKVEGEVVEGDRKTKSRFRKKRSVNFST